MTVADGIAELMGNDGQVYEAGGRTLEGWAMRFGAIAMMADTDGAASPGGWSPDAVRYVFADGSAIVDAGSGWDIEGSEPWTWASEARR